MRVGDYCGQGAIYLHWNSIRCIQERGLGLCFAGDCLKLEGFMWYLIAFMAKAIQEHRQFPSNCFSYDVQPPFPVSYIWWFCTVSISLALKQQGIFVTRIVSHYWLPKMHHLLNYFCYLCVSSAGSEGSLSSFIFTRVFLLAGVIMWPLGGFLKQLQVVRCWFRMMHCQSQLTCC